MLEFKNSVTGSEMGLATTHVLGADKIPGSTSLKNFQLCISLVGIFERLAGISTRATHFVGAAVRCVAVVWVEDDNARIRNPGKFATINLKNSRYLCLTRLPFPLKRFSHGVRKMRVGITKRFLRSFNKCIRGEIQPRLAHRCGPLGERVLQAERLEEVVVLYAT